MKEELTKNMKKTEEKFDLKTDALQAQIEMVGVEVITTVKEELSKGLKNSREDTLDFMQKNCDMFMEAVNTRLNSYTLLHLDKARPNICVPTLT